jgi:hypothetical protein
MIFDVDFKNEIQKRVSHLKFSRNDDFYPKSATSGVRT